MCAALGYKRVDSRQIRDKIESEAAIWRDARTIEMRFHLFI